MSEQPGHRLSEIEERWARATPGPWRRAEDSNDVAWLCALLRLYESALEEIADGITKYPADRARATLAAPPRGAPEQEEREP